jgi:hypothetical protein
MVAPGRWRDDGPGSAHRMSFGGALVTARVAPKLSAPTNGQMDRQRREIAARPVCGAPLRFKGQAWQRATGEVCARVPGHSHTHRSRATMDREMLARRGA